MCWRFSPVGMVDSMKWKEEGRVVDSCLFTSICSITMIHTRQQENAMAELRNQSELLPLAQSFVLCRDIFENARNGEFILVGPLKRLHLPAIPFQVVFSIYAHLTNGHGKYQVGLELRNPEGERIWSWIAPKPLDMTNPLHPHEFTLYDAVMEFHEVGRHEMVLLINDQDVIHHVLDVHD